MTGSVIIPALHTGGSPIWGALGLVFSVLILLIIAYAVMFQPLGPVR